jgi:hypothetical protein
MSLSSKVHPVLTQHESHLGQVLQAGQTVPEEYTTDKIATHNMNNATPLNMAMYLVGGSRSEYPHE